MRYNLSDIGEIEYSFDFDSDEYNEWLEENELQPSDEALDEYIRDNVTFDLELFDSDTFHHLDFESMSIEDIEDEFGEKIARKVLSDCQESGGGRLEVGPMISSEIDVNNPDELNAEAMKLLKHGGYYKDCRGFILTDGTVIYTPAEHNMVSQIPGINGTFDFIKLGNIRVLPQSVDIAKEPTREQYAVLRQVVSEYSDSTLYLDIMNGGVEKSATYHNPNPSVVLGEIDRYFSEGINPQGNMKLEGKAVRNNNIIITESQYNRLFESDLQEFSLKELSSIPTFKGKVKYCNEFLGNPIAKGSSRLVYQVNDDMVLKLASNAKGVAQNEEEGRNDWYKENYSIFPVVFSHAENFSWILSEFVLPVTERDFVKCFGISSKEFFEFIIKTDERVNNNKYYRRMMSDERYRQLVSENPYLAEFEDYIASYPNAGVCDMKYKANYGLAKRKGKPVIVLLDSGLTEEIYNKYYRGRY